MGLGQGWSGKENMDWEWTGNGLGMGGLCMRKNGDSNGNGNEDMEWGQEWYRNEDKSGMGMRIWDEGRSGMGVWIWNGDMVWELKHGMGT